MGCTSSTTVAGDFPVGSRVYYSGPSRAPTQSTAEELKFGAQGEVIGQTCYGDVVVGFPERVGRVKVRPVELSRSCPVIPGGHKLGDRVYYGGPSRKYPNGDWLGFGAQGRIAGRSCVGDGMDGERIAVIFPNHHDAKAVRLALISKAPPVIPGGYSLGDQVFWCGMSWTFPNGDKLRFGSKGEVAGRSCVGDGLDDERVAVNFPGNKGAVAMRLPEISRDPPVIPGGYCVGDRVFYTYPNWRAPDGYVLKFGVQGKLIGRSCIGDGKDDERAWVLFPGLGYGCIHLDQISRDPPVIPGDYTLGEKVYFCGPSRPVGCNGDRLVFGALGEVAGRACREDVAVMFPGNEDAIDVRLAQISREVPVIPGGFQPGDMVYYTGSGWTSANGDRATFGAQGEVTGRACEGDGMDNECVAVLLPGNRNSILLQLVEVSRETPPNLEERLGEQLVAAMRDDDIPTLAATYRTAGAASLPRVSDAALKASLTLVEHSYNFKDLSALSQAQRAALDAQWTDLAVSAGSALQKLALPRAIQNAEACGDVFGIWAVEQHALANGLPDIARMASASLQTLRANAPTKSPLSSIIPSGDGCGFTGSQDGGIMLMRQMQELVDETYTAWGGYGRQTRTRDRLNERAANYLEVVKVEYLRNSEKYLSYCTRRQVIASEMPNVETCDWDVKTVRAGSLLPQGRPVESRLNEHYLWHGTGPAEAKSIAASGFDMEQAGSGRGSLFGRGLYFAESCLKADEYVKPDKEKRYPLILCRVLLGRVHYCDAEDPWELRESLRASCRTGTGSYHSVLGDREKVRQTFREFVVFDSSQAYPEFIVWVVRK